MSREGRSKSEVHVYGDDNASIERSIVIDGRGQYPQVACDYEEDANGATRRGVSPLKRFLSSNLRLRAWGRFPYVDRHVRQFSSRSPGRRV
jgi:hypothetical protein